MNLITLVVVGTVFALPPIIFRAVRGVPLTNDRAKIASAMYALFLVLPLSVINPDGDPVWGGGFLLSVAIVSYLALTHRRWW